MSRRSGSTTALIALGILLALLAIPPLSFPLMVFGVPLLAGLLVHIALIAFAAEALTGRGPREFILIPILAYGGYYAVYAYEGYTIASKAAELRAANPGQVFTFDPSQHSLVASDALNFAQTHKVPVVYEPNPNSPDQHLAYRLVARASCGTRGDSQGRVMWMSVRFEDKFQSGVCILRMPEAPRHKVVYATRRGDDEVWKRKTGIMVQSTDIIFDGAIVGVYRTASVWRLPRFPMMAIGCGLSKSPKWDCGVEFVRNLIPVDTVPNHVDRAAYDTPLSVMLGLRRYTAADLSNFKGYPQDTAPLARAAEEPARVENEVFAVLQQLLDGQNPQPPHNMGYALALNPQRLAPLAGAMAKRFAIAALPRSAFSEIAGTIFDLVHKPFVADRYRVLYLRAADAGVRTLDFYKQPILALPATPFLRPLPVLAICRIGQADAETIAELKRRYLEPQPDSFHGMKSILLVTLIKLGEEPFVRANIEMIPARQRDWANAVLAGEGLTETGPNNCMGETWNWTSYLAPIMAPSLERAGGWKRRAGA